MIRFALSDGGLSTAQLEMLHDRAMGVLGAVGIEVAHPAIQDLLRHRPGFSVAGDRIRLGRGLLEECVDAVRRRRQAADRAGEDGEWHLHVLPGCPMNLADWRSRDVRPMRQQDAVEIARLVEVLHDEGVRGTSPGVPQDVPPEIQPIRTFRIGAENCREGGSAQVSSPRHAAWIALLMEVTGLRFRLEAWILNPLRADPETFAQVYELRAKPIDLAVGCMPLMGLSAPVQVMGAFVIGLASVWGAYAIVREVTGREDIGMDCQIWPVNMRTLEIVFGTPEMLLADLVSGQLRDFYGWNVAGCNAFHSMPPLPDQQAAAQRGAYGMAMALAGRRDFRWGGLLSQDLVFSPVQLLLDLEMMRYYRHVVNGFEFSEAAFCLEAIASAGTSGSFLADATTLDAFRDVLWRPKLWNSDSLAAWRAGGGVGAAERAGEEIEALLKKHDYHLPDAVAGELDRLCREAEADLLG